MNALSPEGTAGLPMSIGSRRKGGRRLAVGVLCAAGLCAAGYLGQEWWRHGRFVESTDDAYVGGDVAAMAPHVAGFVTAILADDNAHVSAGQLLVRLDGRDYQAALDHARALVAAQAAALQGLRAQRGVQVAMIRQSGAELSGRSARAVFTAIDDSRYATLSVTRAGSLQDAERAQATAAEAQASWASSGAALEAARGQLDVLDAQIAQGQAMLGQGEADLRRAALDVGYTEIRAPAEGYVANRAVRAGAYVAAGTYLLSVVPAGGLWVDANFKEDQLAALRPGQPATLVADAAPGRVFRGRVLSLAPGTGAVFSVIPPENATGNFTKIVQRVPVRIALDGGDGVLGGLRPGLSVVVSVDTQAGR